MDFASCARNTIDVTIYWTKEIRTNWFLKFSEYCFWFDWGGKRSTNLWIFWINWNNLIEPAMLETDTTLTTHWPSDSNIYTFFPSTISLIMLMVSMTLFRICLKRKTWNVEKHIFKYKVWSKHKWNGIIYRHWLFFCVFKLFGNTASAFTCI